MNQWTHLIPFVRKLGSQSFDLSACFPLFIVFERRERCRSRNAYVCHFFSRYLYSYFQPPLLVQRCSGTVFPFFHNFSFQAWFSLSSGSLESGGNLALRDTRRQSTSYQVQQASKRAQHPYSVTGNKLTSTLAWIDRRHV